MAPMAMRRQVEKAVIRAPDRVARAVASRATTPEEAWLLRQPQAVRHSYWREVVCRGNHQREREIWMLRQHDAVRQSYIDQVLVPGPPEGTTGHRADPVPLVDDGEPSVASPRTPG